MLLSQFEYILVEHSKRDMYIHESIEVGGKDALPYYKEFSANYPTEFLRPKQLLFLRTVTVN